MAFLPKIAQVAVDGGLRDADRFCEGGSRPTTALDEFEKRFMPFANRRASVVGHSDAFQVYHESIDSATDKRKNIRGTLGMAREAPIATEPAGLVGRGFDTAWRTLIIPKNLSNLPKHRLRWRSRCGCRAGKAANGGLRRYGGPRPMMMSTTPTPWHYHSAAA